MTAPKNVRSPMGGPKGDGREICRMERINEPGAIMYGWLVCDHCGPAYPRVADWVQAAVKYCPFCGRKVVSA